MRRDQLPHARATYVMPRWQAMYVSVNKAASTSLKWLVAEVQEERPERFYEGLWCEPSRAMTIHQRWMWEHTPTAPSLPDEELAAILPTNGWFIFGVVRHPTARLFSAWQSKMLLREAWCVDRFGEADWFPRVPRSGEDIVEDFTRFVLSIARDPASVFGDHHFARQRRLLAIKRMEYSRIYRTSEIAQLLADFEQHIRDRGYDGGPLALREVNETPLRPIPSLFAANVKAACRRLYGPDLKAFGYEDVVPEGLDLSDRYADAAVAEIGRLIERSERIGDLSRRARQLRDEVEAAHRPGLARRTAWRAKQRTLKRIHGAGTYGDNAAIGDAVAPTPPSAIPSPRTRTHDIPI
jgi:hypothetical protein